MNTLTDKQILDQLKPIYEAIRINNMPDSYSKPFLKGYIKALELNRIITAEQASKVMGIL